MTTANERVPTASTLAQSRSKGLASYHRMHNSTQHVVTRWVTRVPGDHAGQACDRLGGADLAKCMRPQILNVDRLLRAAYHDAARAGVDRRVLATYRRQWSSLRSRANSDPRHVELGYRRMARQLDAARTSRHASAFVWR
jgi:hypothetical protein